MTERFTVEQINLMCVFNTTSRAALIRDLGAALDYFEDEEMREIAQKTLNELSSMSDADFSALNFSPAYEDFDVFEGSGETEGAA